MAIKNLSAILSNLLPFCIVILCLLFFNEKLNKINNLWQDANQAVIQNQQNQIKINRAYSDKLDQLSSYIAQLNEKNRTQWQKRYPQAVQSILKTPPMGLKPQG